MSVFINDSGIEKEAKMIYVNDGGIDKLVSGGTGLRGGVLFLQSDTFIVPEGVYAISAVCVGRGGSNGGYNRGGGGGALAWGNNIPVTPGQRITVTIDDTSSRISNWLVAGAGSSGSTVATGLGGVPSGTYLEGGGRGGDGADGSGLDFGGGGGGGGGGAGGYMGDGGDGGPGHPTSQQGPGLDGSGGGGGGGGGGSEKSRGGGGGGVGVYGLGESGTGGAFTPGSSGGGGGGGSGGTSGDSAVPGTFGGGAGGRHESGADRSAGAVRIIWGEGRAFPDTDVGAD